MKIFDCEQSSLHSRACIRALLFLLLCFSVTPLSSDAQGPASRPILFVHGFCGSVYDFVPLIGNLYPKVDNTLYPSSDVYLARYDSVGNAVQFWRLEGAGTPLQFPQLIDEDAIPANARFFGIIFYDPVGKSTNPLNVEKVSILNKAYEVAQVVRHITLITKIKDVIVVAHSQGGLDTRAYIEGLASPDKCYDYDKSQPDYTAPTCRPGCTSTSTPSCNPGYEDAAYAHDVGDLITVDTPHLGSPLAALSKNWVGVLDHDLKCAANSSTDKTEFELHSKGVIGDGSGLIELLNYETDAVDGLPSPKTNTAPIQAIQDYFNDVSIAWDTLTGESDDVVTRPSQSIQLSVQSQHTSSPVTDIPLAYTSPPSYVAGASGFAGISDCWKPSPLPLPPGLKPMMHFMTCLRNLEPTQSAIAEQINAHDKGIVIRQIPSPVTIQASAIGGSTATLHGSITPNGTNGTVRFQWGKDADLKVGILNSCSGATCPLWIPNGQSQSFNFKVSGLANSTTYFFRIVALDSDNNSVRPGNILKFSTGNPPLVTTKAATTITQASATINGSVNPFGANGEVRFEWGTDPTLTTGSQYSCAWNSCPTVISNSQTQQFSFHLARLRGGTSYYYRVTVRDVDNGSNWPGLILKFTTDVFVPSITSLSPISVSAGSAAQTLTITGAGFLRSSFVIWNGILHASTFVSTSQIRIPLTSNDLAKIGSFSIVAANPAPEGGPSRKAVFQVTRASTSTTVTVGARPLALAINPKTNRIYAVNESGNSVTVIDGATGNATAFGVGLHPSAIAVNETTNRIYVANAGSGTVTVIDGATNRTTSVSVGNTPVAIAINLATNRIYVVNWFSYSVTVINGSDNSTATIDGVVYPGADLPAVAMNPRTNKIYVTNSGPGGNIGIINVIDGVDNSYQTVNFGLNPIAVAVDSATNRIYIPNFWSNDVTVLDGVTLATSSVSAGACPIAVAINQNTNRIFVANRGCSAWSPGSLTSVEGSSSVAETVAYGDYVALAVNQKNNRIYAAAADTNSVSVIDGVNSSIQVIKVGVNPTAIAINSVTGNVYVANTDSNTVSVIPAN